jgi:hypothetical protein
MRTRDRIVAAGLGLSAALLAFAPRDAAAQPVTPVGHVAHDQNWGTVSNISMMIGAGLVTVMPRVYYSSPESTVGWKARYHVSVLAPVMSMTALTLLVDGPIRKGIGSTRPGCPSDLTGFEGSGCESFGGPSTQAYAAWGAFGGGLGVFLVDTFKYSDSRFNAWSFLGNVVLPLTAGVITDVGRGVAPAGTQAYESGGQIVAGTLTGLGSGLILGLGYSLLQRPNCGYGNNLICW